MSMPVFGTLLMCSSLSGCDDGKILQWRLPADGLHQSANEPEAVYYDSADKVSFFIVQGVKDK